MNNLSTSFYLLAFSTCIIFFFLLYLFRHREKENQLHTVFIYNLLFTFIISFGVLLQSFYSNVLHINPMIFENLIYIGTCFLPVSIFFTGIIFTHTKIKFKKSYLLFFVIPVLTLLIIWTNKFHHLFYVNYSYDFGNMVYGPYFYIHSIYSYGLMFIGIIMLLRFSIKSSGLFSMQSVLLLIGFSCPLIVNLLGCFFEIIPMTVYATPIASSVSILCFTFAMLKFNFLNITPISLQKIVDRISDGYLVLDENNKINNFNATLLKMFHLNANDIISKNFFDVVQEYHLFDMDILLFKKYIDLLSTSNETFYFDKKLKDKDIYYTIEVSNIKNDKYFIGTLILFKDITQHVLDIHTIEDNQRILMERERLASLGQLIGGVAHNLKTPIMSISGAAEGLSDLVKEYESSIGDPEVTVEDHHDIAKDMYDWIDKIRSYTAYMSDIITAVKGQAVTMNDEQDSETFTIEELVKRVDILMKHELKNALVSLNINVELDSSTSLKGNVNSLVQVINNMISNAIQAYNGETNKSINLTLQKNDNNLVISVQDFANGLPAEVQQKLFKEMITTKGKNGTGLGLFMSYSTVRAHFNGNIEFETEKGVGTTFHIIIPFSN